MRYITTFELKGMPYRRALVVEAESNRAARTGAKRVFPEARKFLSYTESEYSHDVSYMVPGAELPDWLVFG